jgi:cellulose synthase/poly-beta-1,6-N-acetylglucosamine synthase-like glycosyltransferase
VVLLLVSYIFFSRFSKAVQDVLRVRKQLLTVEEISCYRYLRLLVNVIAFQCHRTIPIPEEPRLTSDDVTVVIPSLGGDGLEDTIWSILQTNPHEVILVTIDANRARAENMIFKMGVKSVRVLTVAQPNKRRQMVRAIPEITTSVTVFADDDVTWGPKLLPWMLAPLENEDDGFGGVGTNQWLRDEPNSTIQQSIWRFLNVLYLQRRNFDCSACNNIDGGLPCLSGRTVAYRTEIIKEPSFMEGFTNEVWGFCQNYRLNADDDNFITRWLYSHGWKIAFQYHREAEVLTELEANPKFLKQCLRWSRSNWRSNLTSMFVEMNVWR